MHLHKLQTLLRVITERKCCWVSNYKPSAVSQLGRNFPCEVTNSLRVKQEPLNDLRFLSLSWLLFVCLFPLFFFPLGFVYLSLAPRKNTNVIITSLCQLHCFVLFFVVVVVAVCVCFFFSFLGFVCLSLTLRKNTNVIITSLCQLHWVFCCCRRCCLCVCFLFTFLGFVCLSQTPRENTNVIITSLCQSHWGLPTAFLHVKQEHLIITVSLI